jgi:hypothetical protein
MSRAHDKDVHRGEPPAPVPEPASESPGKVVVDARGRNVWQWAKGVLDSTSVLLKRLENKDLALEPTRKVPILADGKPEKGANSKGKPRDSKAMAVEDEGESAARHPALQRARRRDGGGGGFDPYNSR